MNLSVLFDGILDLFFPRECLLCSRRIQQEPLRTVCAACVSNLAWSDISLCPKCGRPRETAVCGSCEEASYDSVWSLGPYQGDLKKMIHIFKFHNNRAVGRDLTQWMLRSPSLKDLLRETDVLIPVPMQPLKQKERGFNQAAVLALQLAVGTGIRLREDILTKRPACAAQTYLGREDRWENAQMAFASSDKGGPVSLRNLNVVLVDDVLTTGATAHHCASILRRAGARRVAVVAVARSIESE